LSRGLGGRVRMAGVPTPTGLGLLGLLIQGLGPGLPDAAAPRRWCFATRPILDRYLVLDSPAPIDPAFHPSCLVPPGIAASLRKSSREGKHLKDRVVCA